MEEKGKNTFLSFVYKFFGSLLSIRCSHLWHGQLPVRLRGAERRGPMSVSVTGATAGS